MTRLMRWYWPQVRRALLFIGWLAIGTASFFACIIIGYGLAAMGG